MKSVLKPIWQGFVIKFLQAILVLSRLLPLRALLTLGAWLGVLAFRLSKRYRDVALKNLTIAYGDTMSRREKLRITREVFVNFAKSAIEFPVTAAMSEEQVRDLVEFRAEDVAMLNGLLDQGKGLIGVSAHFGNFELMGRRYAIEGFKASVVVRNDNNRAVADMINDFRTRTGYEVIPRGEAVRTLLKKLRSGQRDVVVMLPDQKSDDIFVPFFGVLCGTVAGPALIALRTGSPIIPVFCVRLPGDRHKIIFGTPIEPAPTEDKEADVERLMTQINCEIERVVRQYPEQWLWLHDRWRVRPPAEVSARWEARKAASQEAAKIAC